MVPTWCRFVHHPPSLRRRVKAGVTNIFAGTIPVNMVTLEEVPPLNVSPPPNSSLL